MEEHTVPPTLASRVCWSNLEAFAREQIQSLLQRLLEEELTELLGREKSQRREPTAAAGSPETAYRNGHGKPRRLTTPVGTLEVRRPRVRGLAERFESRILPLFKRRTVGVDRLLPELYLHGLAAGDFDLALRGLLGEGAPLSPGTLARLKAGWQQEYDAWNQRRLEGQRVVYLWVDGIYVKAGLEKEKAALLVVLGALEDGSKVILAVKSGHRESTESWTELLRDLQQRGLNCPRLVIGDGALGIWGALANIYPAAGEQRCWNHRQVNVLDKLPKSKQPGAKVWLKQLMYAPTREKATELKGKFQAWCRQQGQAAAGELLETDWDRLVAYYDFPEEHWQHLRTTNPVESPFAAVRLRTTAAKRYKKVENATAVIWKTLQIAEQHFRKLNAPELLPSVAAGARYENGRRRLWSSSEVEWEEKVAA
jgi:putative transposase